MKHYETIEALKDDCKLYHGEVYGVNVIAMPIYSECDGELLYYVKHYVD